MTEPAELVEQARRAFGDALSCRVNMSTRLGDVEVRILREAMAAAIAAVRAYDEANQARADEPATERAPPADGWEAF